MKALEQPTHSDHVICLTVQRRLPLKLLHKDVNVFHAAVTSLLLLLDHVASASRLILVLAFPVLKSDISDDKN